VFDDLFEPGSEAKLDTVKKLLLGFVNKHLIKLGVQISNFGNQFHDGVYLIMLIGSLGNFFVPLYNYNIAPTSTEMKIHNVTFAFKLVDSLDIKRRKWNPAGAPFIFFITFLSPFFFSPLLGSRCCQAGPEDHSACRVPPLPDVQDHRRVNNDNNNNSVFLLKEEKKRKTQTTNHKRQRQQAISVVIALMPERFGRGSGSNLSFPP